MDQSRRDAELKNEEPQLFKYKVVYTPRYIRKGHINPSGKFEDITLLFDDVLSHMKGKFCSFQHKSPLLIIARFSKHGYAGLVIRFTGLEDESTKTNKALRNVEFLLVNFDDANKNANPYALTVYDKFSLREDPDRAFDMLKACVGHYYYSGKKLNDASYFINEKKPVDEAGCDFSTLKNLLIGKRNIAVTKHDLLNEYLKTLEPGVAYNRKKQADMVETIYKRFGIGINDREKAIERPFYYLNKAMKYTDFKMAPVSKNHVYDTAATYYGMRVLMPKSKEERVDYFDEITTQIRISISGK